MVIFVILFVYSTIVLHANLQYAEIPVSEIPKVVKNSYVPVISALLEMPKIEVVLNFTGVTLEILNSEYPEVIDLLKLGIDKGKFEMTGCGYSHPIFPLLPVEDMKKQIEFNQKVMEKTLDYKPKGFWLPELAYDPLLPKVLKTYDFSYVFIDEELYNLSNPLLNDHNQYNSPYYSATHYIIDFMKAKGIIRKLRGFNKARKGIKNFCKRTDFSPVELKGVKGTITGVKVPQSWSIFSTASVLGMPFMKPKKVAKTLSKFSDSSGLIIPYGTDIEFFGYRSFIEGKLPTEEDLKKLLQKMQKIKGFEMILPSKYLEKHKPKDLGYMKTGSWGPSRRLDIWTEDEDNRKLERLCCEARWYFAHLPETEITEEMWKHLLLAENSDGRGWDPIPERRLDCLSNAYEAIELARERYLERYIRKAPKK